MGLAARSRAFVAQDGCAAQAVVISNAIDSASPGIVRGTGITTLGRRVFAGTRAARPSAGSHSVISERRQLSPQPPSPCLWNRHHLLRRQHARTACIDRTHAQAIRARPRNPAETPTSRRERSAERAGYLQHILRRRGTARGRIPAHEDRAPDLVSEENLGQLRRAEAGAWKLERQMAFDSSWTDLRKRDSLPSLARELERECILSPQLFCAARK